MNLSPFFVWNAKATQGDAVKWSQVSGKATFFDGRTRDIQAINNAVTDGANFTALDGEQIKVGRLNRPNIYFKY